VKVVREKVADQLESVKSSVIDRKLTEQGVEARFSSTIVY